MIQIASRNPGTREAAIGKLIAVCVSPGSIPKRMVSVVRVTRDGLAGDGHAHAKHNRPERAVSLFDLEILTQLQKEGFPLYPGAIGENLTVAGLHVQRLPPGALLEIGDVLLRLEDPRKPCYVLDAINPSLKDVIAGRCGYMASVVRGGIIRPGLDVVSPPAIEQSHSAFSISR
jgi:MOSC domain-containing protein YiiM